MHPCFNFGKFMNICKGPTSLEEACNPAAMSSAESDNNISEWKNGIVTETDDSDDGSVKPSPPSGMWGLMQKLFIFDLWTYLFMMSIIIIFDFDYVYFWLELWWILLFFLSMWCIFLSSFFRDWYPK